MKTALRRGIPVSAVDLAPAGRQPIVETPLHKRKWLPRSDTPRSYGPRQGTHTEAWNFLLSVATLAPSSLTELFVRTMVITGVLSLR